ncbi:MAG: beta-galactosidase [Armatimonadetes bacterium]|nr:beta-galactosidase [Armatimonadota bacterium]
MSTPYPPLNPRFPHLLHGGDYNPDQWLDRPDILDEDMRLAKLAGINSLSIGIFAWAALEPEEGRYTFDWLDATMDRFAAHGIQAVLATPSGARPAWMSAKYPEVLRVQANRQRNLHGMRHNHCYTSPFYRQKVAAINQLLAERYGSHPALLVWHLSNEYGGECHCDLCQEAFRAWLKRRYHNDLAALNQAWWTAFWSHTYTAWEQIESPAPHGEMLVHGHNLDWKRFVTDQTVDFMLAEIEPLKRLSPDVPVTTNLMGTYPGLNYWRLAPHLDVVSWDNYPVWHGGWEGGVPDARLASEIAFLHDLNRSLKGGRPFMLMESSPSATNWQRVGKLRRPGMHQLSSLQAVAHGSDTVQYFQFRKSRGASEKFHGAVVDHVGHERTRVFGEVAQVGELLSRLDGLVGAATPTEVAVIYDWENRWAIDDTRGPRNDHHKGYEADCKAHHRALWRQGIPTDVIDMEQPLEGYQLVIAPMLHMVREGVAERITEFVKSGGTFVATYLSGIVDQSDLCFLGGWPGPLREVLGIWSEEIDALHVDERNALVLGSNELGLAGRYETSVFCDLIHPETAATVATYEQDFYAGRAALTVNHYGAGQAWYLCARPEQRFLDDFYRAQATRLGLRRALEAPLPEGVSATWRTAGEREYLFVMNFNADPVEVSLDRPRRHAATGEALPATTTLPGYGLLVATD